MFVVFALFRLFVAAGKPLGAVPLLFIAVILIAGALGEWVARVFSEPMNRRLRQRFAGGRSELGSVIDADDAASAAAADSKGGRDGSSP
jgi:peptidoglycan/LPS O-acetylase OafA/YrhL